MKKQDKNNSSFKKGKIKQFSACNKFKTKNFKVTNK